MDKYHHGNLKETLLTRARALLEESPSGELPGLRELARQAGVTATAVYHHFPSKDDLLADVAASLLEELLASWDSLSLEALGPAYLEFFRVHPSALGLLFGVKVRKVERVRELQDQAYAKLVLLLPPLPNGEPDHAAGLAVWAMVQGLAHLYASGTLGCDPLDCPGGPDLWYQSPSRVMAELSPYITRLLGVNSFS